MGLFNRIIFKMGCPKCGGLLSEFQTKDGELTLKEVDFFTVNKFYDFCQDCNIIVEFKRKPAKSINDYDMIIKEIE